MTAAYERLVQHLDEHHVRYEAHAEVGVICANFHGEVGAYRVVASVDPEADLFEVFSCAPIRVPIGARPSIAEALMRANYGLKIGKLEMDFDDGEIRFHVAQMLNDGLLHEAVIGRSLGMAIAMLDRYLPAILSVVYGNELPQDAVRSAEQMD